MPDTGTYSTFLEHLLQTLKTVGATSIFKILLAVVILIIGSKLIKIIIKLLNKSHSYAKLDESVRSFLNSFIRVVLYAVLYITAATALGVPETSLVTALASCGLAVGLALRLAFQFCRRSYDSDIQTVCNRRLHRIGNL